MGPIAEAERETTLERYSGLVERPSSAAALLPKAQAANVTIVCSQGTTLGRVWPVVQAGGTLLCAHDVSQVRLRGELKYLQFWPWSASADSDDTGWTLGNNEFLVLLGNCSTLSPDNWKVWWDGEAIKGGIWYNGPVVTQGWTEFACTV